jgi:RimJ/RimL family protein N-acetyltransferase
MVERVVLAGRVVRLEPLSFEHVPGLVAAAAERREHYTWSWVPSGEEQVVRYVSGALAEEEAGHHLPFVHVRLDTAAVAGTTRFADIEPWQWPPGSAMQRVDRPDTVEIGYTWLAASAQRTGINTEAKLLMLTHAFDVWGVHAVFLKTDARNVRSRNAILRIGAQFEGVRRAHSPAVDGTPRDSAYFSIVAAEWPAVRAQLEQLCARGLTN